MSQFQTVPGPARAIGGRLAALTSSTRSPARIGQIALGLIWIADGLLKLQPYFFSHFVSGVIDASAAGQPGFIAHPITWFGGIVKPYQAVFVALAVFAEVSIGAGLMVRRTVKPALLLSFIWALNVWLTGEGLGFLFTGTTPNPLTGIVGTAPLYIVAGLLVWPREARGGDSESRLGLLGERGARLVWATLWLAAAALWLFPANAGRDATSSAFASAPSGAGWLSSLHASTATLVGGSGMTVAVLLAVISAEIGLCVLRGRGTRIALIAAMAVSLVFWLLAEGLGGLFTGQATDIGTGPLMILISALLLPLATTDARASSPELFHASPTRQIWRPTGLQGSGSPGLHGAPPDNSRPRG